MHYASQTAHLCAVCGPQDAVHQYPSTLCALCGPQDAVHQYLSTVCTVCGPQDAVTLCAVCGPQDAVQQYPRTLCTVVVHGMLFISTKYSLCYLEHSQARELTMSHCCLLP